MRPFWQNEYLLFLIWCFLYVGCYCISELIEKDEDQAWPSLSLALQPMSTLSSYWICKFGFATVNLNLPWWIWIFLVNLNLPGEFEFAVVSLPQWISICRGGFELGPVNLNLPQRIWIYRGKLEFAVLNLNFAVANWNSLWWIWNCRSDFEFFMVNLKLP